MVPMVPNRAQFSHPPGVQYRYAICFLELAQHGRGTGRATYDGASHAREWLTCFLNMTKQALPDSRHASGERDLLGFEQVIQRFSVKSRPGE